MISVTPEYELPHWAKFKIGQDSLISVSNVITHLELIDIFVEPKKRGNNYGVILMVCALDWYRKMVGANFDKSELRGVYEPRGDAEKVEEWYGKIGARFEGAWVIGDVKTLYEQCMSIINANEIKYALLADED